MKAGFVSFVAVTLALLALSGCGGVGAIGADNNGDGAEAPKPPPPPPRPPAPFKPAPDEVVMVLPDAVGPIAFAPAGRLLITGKNGDPSSLILWDLQTSKPTIRAELTGHPKLIWAVAFSPNGQALASCSLDQTIRIWDMGAEPQLRTTVHWDHGPVDSIAWTADSKALACSGGDDKQGGENWLIKIWDVAGPAPREILAFNGGTPLALSPDGKTLASAWATEVRLWTLAGKKVRPRDTLLGHSRSINALKFSPDGKFLVSVAKDRGVRLWDLAENDERASCEGHNDQVVYVAWAPDAKMFATAGDSRPGRVLLWSSAGKKLREWSVPDNDIYGSPVSFSADSEWLAFPVINESARSVYVLRTHP